MLIVVTAMVFGAAGSTRGIASPGLLMLGSRAAAASALSSLPAVKGDESLNKTIFSAAPNSAVTSVFVTVSAQNSSGDGNNDKNPPPPPPRSKRCPKDPDNQKDQFSWKDPFNRMYLLQGQGQNDPSQDQGQDQDKDKDCGKGDDSNLP